MVVNTKKKGEVTFVFDAQPDAKKVYLAGTFNNWDPQAKRMTKFKDRSFRARLRLDAGHHEYKFVVDGNWLNDPDAESHTTNQYGTSNSIVSVG